MQHHPSCRDTLPKRYGFIVLAPHNQIPPFTVAQRAREPKWAVVAETAPRSSREFNSEEILIHCLKLKLPPTKYQPSSRHLHPRGPHIYAVLRMRHSQHQFVRHDMPPNKYKSIVSNDPPTFSITATALESANKAPALQLITRKAVVGSWDVDASNTRTSCSIIIAE